MKELEIVQHGCSVYWQHIDYNSRKVLDLNVALRILLDQIVEQLKVDATRIFLCDPKNKDIKLAAGCGFYDEIRIGESNQYGEGFAGYVALRRRPFLTTDLTHPGHTAFTRKSGIIHEGFIAYCGIPIILKGCLLGVIEVLHRQSLDMNREWFRLFNSLAEKTSSVITSADQFNRILGLENPYPQFDVTYFEVD